MYYEVLLIFDAVSLYCTKKILEVVIINVFCDSTFGTARIQQLNFLIKIVFTLVLSSASKVDNQSLLYRKHLNDLEVYRFASSFSYMKIERLQYRVKVSFARIVEKNLLYGFCSGDSKPISDKRRLFITLHSTEGSHAFQRQSKSILRISILAISKQFFLNILPIMVKNIFQESFLMWE